MGLTGTKLAEELNGQHIGLDVAFAWHFPVSNVQANVNGELREVHHTAGDEVVVWLAGSESVGDKTEFIIPRGAHVTVTA